WSLSGADAGLFTIDASGVISFNAAPDFEAAGDSDTDNVYELTIEGEDGNSNVGTLAITVTVTDEDEINPT
ncbi:cadherin repeat domain-containing protein, partial [Sulfitobacter geojensis]|uniref:cadherin repeat domain-containing protein n=1 Tax=Sulfitobacter geojensis TaxID=1342299 RepID=UPI003B8D6672